MRDAGQEVSLYRGRLAGGRLGGPGRPAAGQAHLADAGGRAGRADAPRSRRRSTRLDPIDREVLALRHFEELSHAEAAQVLGIEESAAAKRYIRALKRLKAILASMPGGLEGV